MSRGAHVLRAAIVAAGLALAGFFVGLTDPAYYEPETFLDYSAALLTTGSAIAATVALWVWGSAIAWAGFAGALGVDSVRRRRTE